MQKARHLPGKQDHAAKSFNQHDVDVEAQAFQRAVSGALDMLRKLPLHSDDKKFLADRIVHFGSEVPNRINCPKSAAAKMAIVEEGFDYVRDQVSDGVCHALLELEKRCSLLKSSDFADVHRVLLLIEEKVSEISISLSKARRVYANSAFDHLYPIVLDIKYLNAQIEVHERYSRKPTLKDRWRDNSFSTTVTAAFFALSVAIDVLLWLNGSQTRIVSREAHYVEEVDRSLASQSRLRPSVVVPRSVAQHVDGPASTSQPKSSRHISPSTPLVDMSRPFARVH